MTPEDRAALKALDQAATPGPWEVFGGYLIRLCSGPAATPLLDGRLPFRPGLPEERASSEADANLALVVAARNALPALLSALEKAEAEADRQHTMYVEAADDAMRALRDKERAESEVSALRAEVERMRAALTKIANSVDGPDGVMTGSGHSDCIEVACSVLPGGEHSNAR